MKKGKILLLASAIIMEIVAIILIVKSKATNSSPTVGTIFLVIGMTFLVIGITMKVDKPKEN